MAMKPQIRAECKSTEPYLPLKFSLSHFRAEFLKQGVYRCWLHFLTLTWLPCLSTETVLVGVTTAFQVPRASGRLLHLHLSGPLSQLWWAETLAPVSCICFSNSILHTHLWVLKWS